jgi:PAS domain S-box-containing protein
MENPKAKILCVDDDADLLQLNSTILQSAGYEVIEACSGNECLQRIKEIRPDLVLLDVMLPDADGFELCKKIKEDPEMFGTYVILISGMEISSGSQVKGLEIGADGYITRPITAPELIARIQAILRIKITEMALRKSMERYQMLIETMNEGLGIVNENMIVTFINDKLCELTGYAKNEIIGNPLLAFFNLENQEILRNEFNKVRNNICKPFEIKGKKKNGRDFYVIFSPRAIFDSSGEFKGAFAVLTDITRNKEIEEANTKNFIRLKTIMDSVGDGIYGVDRNGKTIFVNPALLRMTGYSEKELIGRNLHYILRHTKSDGSAYEREDCPILMTLLKGETFFNITDEVVWRKDGSRFPVEYTSAPIVEQDRITGAVVVIRDITERMQAEEEIKRLNKDLERRVVQRTRQLEAVIRELEDEIFERKRTEEKISKYADRLKTLSNRLIEIQEAERKYIARELHEGIGQTLNGLKNVLDMMVNTRPNANEALFDIQNTVKDLLVRVRNMSLDLRPFMLDDMGILPALLWHFDRFQTQTKIRVRFSHDGLNIRFRPEVETAAYRVVQEALMNVAGHSCADEVIVFIKADSNNLTINIEDKGIGFDYSAVKALGNSAGLKWMQERISLLGGKLFIESSKGKGTRLTVTLPLTDMF